MVQENNEEDIDLEEKVEKLEDRIQAIEDIFAPAVIDRQTSHVEATKYDARETLSEGDVKTVKIFDPPGQGSDLDSGVGKINGIVTFVNCDGLNVEQDDVVHCRITDVLPNAAHGVATQMAEYE
jgi:predicted RNA-binding protein with TRAM domain